MGWGWVEVRLGHVLVELPEHVQTFGECNVLPLKQMPVAIHRDLDAGVPGPGLNLLRVRSDLDRQRDGSVPKVMHSHLRCVSLLARLRPLALTGSCHTPLLSFKAEQ